MNLRSRVNRLERLEGHSGMPIEEIATEVIASGRWLAEVRARGQNAEAALAVGDPPLPPGLDADDAEAILEADVGLTAFCQAGRHDEDDQHG